MLSRYDDFVYLLGALLVLAASVANAIPITYYDAGPYGGAFSLCEATAYNSTLFPACFTPVIAEWGAGLATQGNLKITIRDSGPMPPISLPTTDPYRTTIQYSSSVQTPTGYPSLYDYMRLPGPTTPASVTFPVPWHGGSLQEVNPGDFLQYNAGPHTYTPDMVTQTSNEYRGGTFAFNYHALCGDPMYSTNMPRQCKLRADIGTVPNSYPSLMVCGTKFETTMPDPPQCDATNGFTYDPYALRNPMEAAQGLSRCAYSNVDRCFLWGADALLAADATKTPYLEPAGRGILEDQGAQFVGTVTWIKPPLAATGNPVYLKYTNAFNRDHHAPILIKQFEDNVDDIQYTSRMMTIPGLQDVVDAPRPAGNPRYTSDTVFVATPMCRMVVPYTAYYMASDRGAAYRDLTGGVLQPKNIPTGHHVYALITGALPADHYVVHGAIQFKRPTSGAFADDDTNQFMYGNQIKYFRYPIDAIHKWTAVPEYWNPANSYGPKITDSTDLEWLPICSCNSTEFGIEGNVICDANYNIPLSQGLPKPSYIGAPGAVSTPSCSITMDTRVQPWFHDIEGYIEQDITYSAGVVVNNPNATLYSYRWYVKRTRTSIVSFTTPDGQNTGIRASGPGTVVIRVAVTEKTTYKTGWCSMQLQIQDTCGVPTIRGGTTYIINQAAPLVLDAIGSVLKDRNQLPTYEWSIVATEPAGLTGAASLSSQFTPVTIFRATQPGTYFVLLRVTGNRRLAPADMCFSGKLWPIRVGNSAADFTEIANPDMVQLPGNCFEQLGNLSQGIPPSYSQEPDPVQPPQRSLQPIPDRTISAGGSSGANAQQLVSKQTFDKITLAAIIVVCVIVGMMAVALLANVRWRAFLKRVPKRTNR